MGKALSGELSSPCDRSCFSSPVKSSVEELLLSLLVAGWVFSVKFLYEGQAAIIISCHV